MEKRGTDNILMTNILYLVVFVLFFSGMFYFVLRYNNGVALWEDFYAKEIAMIVNSGQPGQEVILDVSKATELAYKSGMDYSDIFSFDNVNHEVVVKLKPNSGKAFKYFNDVDVVDWKVELISGGLNTNRLKFSIAERQNG